MKSSSSNVPFDLNKRRTELCSKSKDVKATIATARKSLTNRTEYESSSVTEAKSPQDQKNHVDNVGTSTTTTAILEMVVVVVVAIKSKID